MSHPTKENGTYRTDCLLVISILSEIQCKVMVDVSSSTNNGMHMVDDKLTRAAVETSHPLWSTVAVWAIKYLNGGVVVWRYGCHLLYTHQLTCSRILCVGINITLNMCLLQSFIITVIILWKCCWGNTIPRRTYDYETTCGKLLEFSERGTQYEYAFCKHSPSWK